MPLLPGVGGLGCSFKPVSFKPHASNLPVSNSQPAKTEVVVWISRNQSKIVVNCDHHPPPFHIQVKHSGGGRRLPEQMLPYSRLFGLTYSSGTHYTTQSARCRGNMGDVVGSWRIQVQAGRKQVMSLKVVNGGVGRFKHSKEVPTRVLMLIH